MRRAAHSERVGEEADQRLVRLATRGAVTRMRESLRAVCHGLGDPRAGSRAHERRSAAVGGAQEAGGPRVIRPSTVDAVGT